jgi:GntR family transcriptional repressor for pyruvate dehydrogenase complex
MTGLILKPQKRERLADQLYGQILEQIVSGALPEGARLPSEKEICESFQVSRPVVREALMRLQADGLAMSKQGLGTFVERRPPQGLLFLAKASDIAGLLRCFEVRIPLESETAALAARRHTPSQYSKIAAVHEEFRSGLEDGETSGQVDFKFHRAIAEASGNEIFVLMLEAIHAAIERSMTVALSLTQKGTVDRRRRVIEDHQRIIDAIFTGDAEGAAAAMRYHLSRARQRVTDQDKDK